MKPQLCMILWWKSPISKEFVMNRFTHNRYCSLARCSFLAAGLAFVGLAAGVGQAQVVSRTKGPVQKNETPKQTAQPNTSPFDTNLRNKVALTSTFRAERVDDKIFLKSTVSYAAVADAGKPEDGRYAIYRWKGSDWDRVALQSGPIRLTPNSETRLPDVDGTGAWRFKLVVTADKTGREEVRDIAVAKEFVLRYRSVDWQVGGTWVEEVNRVIETPFRMSGPVKIRVIGVAAEKAAPRFHALGLETKIKTDKTDYALYARWDITLYYRSVDWQTKVFATEAARNNYVRSLPARVEAKTSIR
jgi:hypothetical protein